MLSKFKEFMEFAAKHGLNLPTAHDATRNEPSTTLLVFYIGTTLAVGSILAYHYDADLMAQTSMSILFFVLSFVMMRMRAIDKFKINLQERSFELEDEPDYQHKENEDEK